MANLPNWVLTRTLGIKDEDTPDWVRENTRPPEDIFQGALVDVNPQHSESVDHQEREDVVGLFEGSPSEISSTGNWNFSHFNPQEFASKGNGRVRVEAKVVQGLDNVRSELGFPIKITSGYRDPDHNTKVGGAKNSQHLHGNAVDINLVGLDDTQRTQLMLGLMKQGFTSFGSYTRSPNMLHADTRQSAAKWHHGEGDHPSWFKTALTEGKWKRG